MCLRRCRSKCWTDEQHSRSDRKMERSSGRTQVVSSYQDTVGIDGEAIEFDWKNVSGFSSVSLVEKSKMIWRRAKSIQKSSQTGLSSCLCSLTLYE